MTDKYCSFSAPDLRERKIKNEEGRGSRMKERGDANRGDGA